MLLLGLCTIVGFMLYCVYARKAAGFNSIQTLAVNTFLLRKDGQDSNLPLIYVTHLYFAPNCKYVEL
jgi:hypothetical protein